MDADGRRAARHRARARRDTATFAAEYRRFWDLLAEAAANALLSLLGPALRTIVNSGGFAPDEVYRTRIIDHLREIHAAIPPSAVPPMPRPPPTARSTQEFARRLETGYPRQIERPVPWRRIDTRPSLTRPRLKESTGSEDVRAL